MPSDDRDVVDQAMKDTYEVDWIEATTKGNLFMPTFDELTPIQREHWERTFYAPRRDGDHTPRPYDS